MSTSRLYSGYRVHDRAALLAALAEAGLAPLHERVILEHVTHRYPDTHPAPPVTSVRIVGHSAGNGVQALVVEVNGTRVRPDGRVYHLTYSLASGHTPVESNSLLVHFPIVTLRVPLDVRVEPF